MPKNIIFIDELVSIAYEAVSEPRHWQEFIEHLVKDFDSDCGDFVTENVERGTTEIFGSTGYDPYFRDVYEHGIHESNLWANNLRDSSISGASHSDNGLITSSCLESSMFYNEWLKPQDLRHSVSAPVCKSTKQMTFFGVVRSRRIGPYNEDDTRLLESIARHVKRAVELSRILERERQRSASAYAVLDLWEPPVILIGNSETVDYYNQSAESLLQKGDSLLLKRDGRLRTYHQGDNLKLSQAIRRAAGYDAKREDDPVSLVLVHRRSGRPLVVVVSPMREKLSADEQVVWRTAAVVLDPERDVRDPYNVLAHLFDFTPKESALALHLARGESLEEFAEVHGTRASTVRWHLKNLQRKTDTHRQIELLRLLSNVLNINNPVAPATTGKLARD